MTYPDIVAAGEAVHSAVERLAHGGMIVVADDSRRENEGDLVCAAEMMTPPQMEFILRHGSGIVCTPMSGQRADDLGLPAMVSRNCDAHQTAFTLSVDHRDVGTGISAMDRTITVRALGSRATLAEQLRRPGHIFPLRARPGGVLERAGHTEAAQELVEMAGLNGVAAITELVDIRHRSPLTGDESCGFAQEHRLPFVRISDLIAHKAAATPRVVCTGSAKIPTPYGEFNAHCYATPDGREHIALTTGDLTAAQKRGNGGALARVHSECATGDIFESQRCDCGSQLKHALQAVCIEGAGVVVYLRGQEGRGIGLGPKLQAYRLQEHGYDTVEANLELGLPADARSYGVAAAILKELGVQRVRLMTNNPRKSAALDQYGVEVVGRLPIPPTVTAANAGYLAAKRDRLGHLIDLPAGLVMVSETCVSSRTPVQDLDPEAPVTKGHVHHDTH
ncbi:MULTISPECIES: GTP cyclohydrolase II [unclassified Mycolicibacterium]|uniref:GTP cyclohydrolase II n=1 Tax=unclassified Mycolicibacterium TaxID=2636767 RepID=UPI002EDB2F1F